MYEFFTNKGAARERESLVKAPAFSITKVTNLLVPFLTVAVAWAIAAFRDVDFSNGEVAAIIVAVIALFAITSTADVMARAIVTTAEKRADARLHMVQLEAPLPATLENQGGSGPDYMVRVLAASDAGKPEFLCLRDGTNVLTWEPASKVHFAGVGNGSAN